MDMSSYLIVTGHFFNPLDEGGWDDIPQGALCYDEHGIITDFGLRGKILSKYSGRVRCEFLEYDDFLITPAFADVHLHAPQFHCRGFYSENLMKWLENFIFAEEEKFSSSAYASNVATELFREMVSYGIGTASIFGSVHPRATDILFQKGVRTSMKLAIGKVMMDGINYENTEQSLNSSVELYRKWDRKNDGRLRYSFTPRFAPSCSEKLLREIGRIVQEKGALCQTHLSETIGEVELVKNMFPDYENYTEIYARNGLLGRNTILTHCIHLNDDEIGLLRTYGCGIAHCPDSNMFLHSGTMDLARMLKERIRVGLGSDIGAGSTLSPFNSMKMMLYSHQDGGLTPEKAFYLATLGGARVIGFGDITGNFAAGKDADFVVLRKPRRVPGGGEHTRQILSHLIFCNGDKHIKAVYLKGERAR
jgi:guanine deaminase